MLNCPAEGTGMREKKSGFPWRTRGAEGCPKSYYLILWDGISESYNVGGEEDSCIKMPAAKTDDLSSISGPRWRPVRTGSLKLSTDLHTMARACTHRHMYAHTHDK